MIRTDGKEGNRTEEVIAFIKCKYYVIGHYPLPCLHLKNPSSLFFKAQRFGDLILSPSSGKTYSIGHNR
jgi:hypothetical protein